MTFIGLKQEHACNNEPYRGLPLDVSRKDLDDLFFCEISPHRENACFPKFFQFQ
jgi:hypothetical protein